MSWEKSVRRVVPYVPGEQPKQKGIIKLNTNENPYPPAPGVERRLKEIDCGTLRLYPDPDAGVLAKELAVYYGLKPSQIFVGVGSDDVISIAFLTFFNSDKPVLFPDVTYSFYDVWADLYRIPYKLCPLDADFRINPEDYRQENGGIIFPNPNAPTGVLESVDTVEEILKANPKVVVIVDEAYIDFGGESCLPLLSRYENLLVVQTFSKSRSMAGMRIGFAIGSEKLIRYLNDVKFSFNSYTMNLPAQLLGAEAVRDKDYFLKTCSKIMETREWVKGELQKLDFHFPDSKANFLFAAHKTISGAVIGIANIIPGVSGGTMAVSMGIYDRLIHCITHLFKEFKKSILFLIPIILGAGIALVASAFGLEYLFGNYPVPTNLLFIGLILGGLPAMCKKVKGKRVNAGHIAAFAIFFVLVAGLALMGEKEGAAADMSFSLLNVIKLFGVGIIASATMVIPGVSGSMILLLIGYYHPIIEAVSSFMRALVSFDMKGILHGMGILVPAGIGIIVGIFAIAKLIEIVFEKFPLYAFWAIIGLIVASPVAIVLMNLASFSGVTVLTALISVITLAVGFFVSMKLGE